MYTHIYIYIHITSCIYPTLVEDLSNLFDTAMVSAGLAANECNLQPLWLVLVFSRISATASCLSNSNGDRLSILETHEGEEGKGGAALFQELFKMYLSLFAWHEILFSVCFPLASCRMAGACLLVAWLTAAAAAACRARSGGLGFAAALHKRVGGDIQAVGGASE